MTKAEVEQLQKNLMALGCDLGTSGENHDGVDGYFGDKTQAAISQLSQQLNALFAALGEPSRRMLRLIDMLADAGWNEVQESSVTVSLNPSVEVPYRDMTLVRGSSETDIIKEAQHHLRALGYLKKGIDGDFGGGTEGAVRSLQFDLLNTDDTSKGAPVSIKSYNNDRATAVSGRLDTGTAACIQDMLNDPRFILLPHSDNAAQENAKLQQIRSTIVPMPFLKQILLQESGMKHFEVSSSGNEDNFIVIGLDRNHKNNNAHITSRGYGAGQYTLFHHPPTQSEVSDFMLNVEANVAKAGEEFREKFNGFVNGSTSGTCADDRIAEFGRGTLRTCKYQSDDPRHLTDCRQCMINAGETDIIAGTTRWHVSSSKLYKTTKYHRNTRLDDVPVRRNIGCDWPYALRRYNGGGVNSYWYQSEVLLRIKG